MIAEQDGEESMLSFRSGLSLGADAAKVIAQAGPHPDPEFPKSLILEWNGRTGWSSRSLALTAIRMCVLSEPDSPLVVMGSGGYVALVSNNRVSEEMVDESNLGPRFRGNIRDMRLIDKHVYATGMNRQVYRREALGRWVHCDDGVVQPLGSLSVSGFSAIDGLTESDIYAAGFNGEIWRYDGASWRQIDSPTNLVLHRIRSIEPDLAFSCGQKGVLLQGTQDAWRAIDHGATDEDLWGMEWFRGSLYVAGDQAVYRLSGNELEVVDTGLGESFTFGHLHASDGALWSFGMKHVARTDGEVWTNVTPGDIGTGE